MNHIKNHNEFVNENNGEYELDDIEKYVLTRLALGQPIGGKGYGSHKGGAAQYRAAGMKLQELGYIYDWKQALELGVDEWSLTPLGKKVYKNLQQK